MKYKLSAEEIKRIADRAERRAAGKDEEEIRSFICSNCKHEIVIDPRLPRDFVPSICKQCAEELEEKGRKPIDVPKALEQMVKIGELLRLIKEIDKEQQDKYKEPDKEKE